MSDFGKLLNLLGPQQERFGADHWQGTFEEFVTQKLSVDPRRYSRTAFQYVYDMILHYGTSEFEDNGELLTRYNLFSDPFDQGANALYGLDRTIMRLVRYIKSAAMQEGKERIFILHGPVGTAKTSLIDLIGQGLEHYSRLPEGESLTFRWELPRNFRDKAQRLGFHVTQAPGEDVVFAVVPSQLLDNPVYLIPREVRKAYLSELYDAKYGKGKYLIPFKMLEGELDHNNAQIFNFLMTAYNGDWKRAVERVKVHRFYYSEIEGKGVARIFPEGNVETGASTISFDENYRYLAELLSSINLIKYNGKYARGNRGLIHYSDIFKKPANYLQHLLSAIEEHKMDFGEVGVNIDVLIIGTTNLPEYDELRKNPISRGLRSRMRKIDVPYLLRYSDEQRIYEQSLAEIRRRRHVMPHTTEVAAMWAVLTRLEKSKLHAEKTFDEATNGTLRKLTPQVKMKLYNDEFDPILNQQDRANLTREVRRTLRNEYLFEGMDGVPTRILQNVFADICETNEERCISPFDVYAGIRKIIDQGPVNYDFLGRKPDDGYHEFDGFLEEIKTLHTRAIVREVETAILNVAPENLDDKIRGYLNNVKAFNNKEKVFNKATGDEQPPDENFMRSIEDQLGVSEDDRHEFRFKAIARASEAARSGKQLQLRETYADLYDSVQKGLYEESRNRINWPLILTLLGKMRDDRDVSGSDKESLKQIEVLLTNMEAHYGYCRKCAMDITLYFIKHKGLGVR